MSRLSDNYYQRKYYLKRDQAPTQTVMKRKMSEALAKVYFKSMTPKLKEIAGLLPPLQGGGTEWYVPPEELLAGRAVLKPIDREHLEEFSSDGLKFKFGQKLKVCHYKAMAKEIKESFEQNDTAWREKILKSNDEAYAQFGKQEAKNNTEKLLAALKQFETLYKTSINKLEHKIRNAALKEIERTREEAHRHMQERLAQLVKFQSTQMYDEYDSELNKHMEKAKSDFVKELEKIRLNAANQVHDAKFEKHLVIEKIRHYLHCESLACQVYVAFKEQEAGDNEMELSKRKHKKTIKILNEEIVFKDEEVEREKELKIKREKFNEIWKKKVCHVVKKFQSFVQYCLLQMPEHAEFFVNMEKLMFLQLSEVIENPDVENNVITPEPEFVTPEPMPKPFYLIYDKGFKPEIHRDLCPEIVTSSSSHFPVMIINKKSIYSACDKFEVFPDKVIEVISGNIKDMEDDARYDMMVPIKYTSPMQLAELKQESSIMQVLQQELPNTRQVPVNCPGCKLPYCFCKLRDRIPLGIQLTSLATSQTEYKTQPTSIESMTISTELQMRREPKWVSYCEYLATVGCKCGKTVKKPLYEHLPPYMKKMSPYGPPELPNYETCDLETLKTLVKKANNIKPGILEQTKEPLVKDASTQYTDHFYDFLCTCLSDDELEKFLATLTQKITITNEHPFKLVDGSLRSASLSKTASSFATARARSLRKLLDSDSDLEDIFRKESCDFVNYLF